MLKFTTFNTDWSHGHRTNWSDRSNRKEIGCSTALANYERNEKVNKEKFYANCGKEIKEKNEFPRTFSILSPSLVCPLSEIPHRIEL